MALQSSIDTVAHVNFTPPHQGPTAEPIDNVLFNQFFRPAAIAAFIAIPLQILFIGIIFSRILMRKKSRKIIPLAMQLPGWLGFALFCMSLIQDTVVISRWAKGDWNYGAACLAPQVFYRFFYFWMVWMVTFTSFQFCLGIIRPKAMLSMRFVTAHNLTRPAIFSILPAIILTAVYLTYYETTTHCAYRQKDHGRHWIIVAFFGLCLLGSATAYFWTLRYLRNADNLLQRAPGGSTGSNISSKMQIRRAATKLFSYSVVSIFLTVPLIVFPVLDASWADDDTRQLDASLSSFVVFCSMPIVLGIVWIINEGVIDKDMLEAEPPTNIGNRSIAAPPITPMSQTSRASEIPPTIVLLNQRRSNTLSTNLQVATEVEAPSPEISPEESASTAIPAKTVEPLRINRAQKRRTLSEGEGEAPSHIGWDSSPVIPERSTRPPTASSNPAMHMKTVSGSFYSHTPPSSAENSTEGRAAVSSDRTEASQSSKRSSLPPLGTVRELSDDSEADRESYVSGFEYIDDDPANRAQSLENLHQGLGL